MTEARPGQELKPKRIVVRPVTFYSRLSPEDKYWANRGDKDTEMRVAIGRILGAISKVAAEKQRRELVEEKYSSPREER